MFLRMIKHFMIAIFTLTISGFTYSAGAEVDSFYDDLLEKHSSNGHLPKQALKEQKFKYKNNKEWQSDFNRQVRGVASTFQEEKKVLRLSNPAIEIPIK